MSVIDSPLSRHLKTKARTHAAQSVVGVSARLQMTLAQHNYYEDNTSFEVSVSIPLLNDYRIASLEQRATLSVSTRN
jgi:hypothetical protein